MQVGLGGEQPYLPGHIGWYKLRCRDTTEAIIGAATGTRIRPQLLLLGRREAAGQLRSVGRTGPLRAELARLVGGNVIAADAGRPWEGWRFASAWGSREVLDVTLVRPELVAEISADTAENVQQHARGDDFAVGVRSWRAWQDQSGRIAAR
ncbi:hypothetical protein PV721_40620 [Streptomyces sp. MB09-01]|uniref:hypothetical protein n=1 Tax=Streptomyces sp. MB09-01 TaxID=3028666 RepID=UPI0029A297C2|nr:hypothetical protein [Streptomyces sp. MB09-01]MDX3540498.1 hypothetical protein [Streptomyces sp. MB09-01]